MPEHGTGANGANTSIAGGSPVESVLPRRRAVPDRHSRARDLHDPEGGRPGERDVASTPGDALAANYTVTNAHRRGRSRSAAISRSGNVTVNLIEPGTFFADRRNNLDFRVAKIFRFGRTRTQVGVDIYNADEHRRGDGLQPGVRRRRDGVADADGDSAGAVRRGSARSSTSNPLRASGSRPWARSH